MKSKNVVNRYYPVAMDLHERRAVVVGGGAVAEQKIKKLLAARARIKVVSPVATSWLRSLASHGAIQWIQRCVCKSDVRGARVVIAATSDAHVNTSVQRWAHHYGSLVNVVDNPGLSDFISPAVLRLSKAIISVHTNGQDPALSRDLKNFLKEQWDAFVLYRHRLSKRAA
ncbi:MAG: NAD(P)-dependent oxidoreductase [Candidatus Omnitrophica bacterium]|nr:NAD(P)-dependent oxidoreductase [Candidatus Omnitrophota bacterium]